MLQIERDYISLIEKSLDQNGDDWAIDSYFASNKKLGCFIWIANGHFALEIRCNGATIGGLTTASCFFGILVPWRRNLLKKIRECSARKNIRQLYEHLKTIEAA